MSRLPGKSVRNRPEWCLGQIFLLLLFLPFLSPPLPAASPSGLTPRADTLEKVDDESADGSFRPLDTLWHDAGRFFTDAWGLLQLPGGWRGKDWTRVGIVAGSGAGLFLLDDEVRDEVTSWRGSDGDALIDAVDHLGHNSVGLIAGGALYLPGLVFDLPWLRLAGRHLAQTLIYSAAVGALFKGTFGRGRPFLDEGPYRFRGPWQEENAWMSLPSGHTVVAFSIASSLAATIDRPWATALLFGSATLTGIGRIYQDQHWGSDILIGAVLTAAIGHGVHALSSSRNVEKPGQSGPPTPSPSSTFSLSRRHGELRVVWTRRW